MYNKKNILLHDYSFIFSNWKENVQIDFRLTLNILQIFFLLVFSIKSLVFTDLKTKIEYLTISLISFCIAYFLIHNYPTPFWSSVYTEKSECRWHKRLCGAAANPRAPRIRASPSSEYIPEDARPSVLVVPTWTSTVMRHPVNTRERGEWYLLTYRAGHYHHVRW